MTNVENRKILLHSIIDEILINCNRRNRSLNISVYDSILIHFRNIGIRGLYGKLFDYRLTLNSFIKIMHEYNALILVDSPLMALKLPKNSWDIEKCYESDLFVIKMFLNKFIRDFDIRVDNKVGMLANKSRLHISSYFDVLGTLHFEKGKITELMCTKESLMVVNRP